MKQQILNRHILTTLLFLFLLGSLPAQAVELGELQVTELTEGGPSSIQPKSTPANVRGDLSGTISDSAGSPIQGAKIYFFHENNWIYYQTDKAGYYKIPVFRRYENIDVVIRAEGFTTLRVTDIPIGMGLPEVNFTGRTTNLNVTLANAIDDSETIVSYNMLTGCIQVAVTDSTSGNPVEVVGIGLELPHEDSDACTYGVRHLGRTKSGHYFARYIEPGFYDLRIWSNQFGIDIYNGFEIKAGDTTIVNLRLPLKKPDVKPNTSGRYSR